MCSNLAPLDLVNHVVITEFPVRILRERAVICRESFFLLYELSDRTEDPFHFRLYSVSNILYKHYSLN